MDIRLGEGIRRHLARCVTAARGQQLTGSAVPAAGCLALAQCGAAVRARAGMASEGVSGRTAPDVEKDHIRLGCRRRDLLQTRDAKLGYALLVSARPSRSHREQRGRQPVLAGWCGGDRVTSPAFD